jgi:hypothetical protein
MSRTLLIEEDAPALLDAISQAWAWAVTRPEAGYLVIWWLAAKGNGQRQLRIGGLSIGLAAAMALAALTEPELGSSDSDMAYAGRVRPDGVVDTVGHLDIKVDLASQLGIDTIIGPKGMRAPNSDSKLQVVGILNVEAAIRAPSDIVRRRELEEAQALAAEQRQRAESNRQGMQNSEARWPPRSGSAGRSRCRCGICRGSASLRHSSTQRISEAATHFACAGLAAEVPGRLDVHQDDVAVLLARQAYDFNEQARGQASPPANGLLPTSTYGNSFIPAEHSDLSRSPIGRGCPKPRSAKKKTIACRFDEQVETWPMSRGCRPQRRRLRLSVTRMAHGG